VRGANAATLHRAGGPITCSFRLATRAAKNTSPVATRCSSAASIARAIPEYGTLRTCTWKCGCGTLEPPGFRKFIPARWWTSVGSERRARRTSSAAARIASPSASFESCDGKRTCRAGSTMTTESNAHFEKRFGIASAAPTRSCPSGATAGRNLVPFSAAAQNGQPAFVLSWRSFRRSRSAVPRNAFAFSPSAPLIDATVPRSGSVRCSITCSAGFPAGSTRVVRSVTETSSIGPPGRGPPTLAAQPGLRMDGRRRLLL
jgi:hypothetical protein